MNLLLNWMKNMNRKIMKRNKDVVFIDRYAGCINLVYEIDAEGCMHLITCDNQGAIDISIELLNEGYRPCNHIME